MDNEEMVIMSKMIMNCFYTSNLTQLIGIILPLFKVNTPNWCSEHVAFIKSKEDYIRGEKATACFGIPLTYKKFRQVIKQIYVLSINFITIENWHETGFHWNIPPPYGKATMNDEMHKKETALAYTISK